MKLIYALYAFLIAAFAGWIMNIIEIVHAGFSSDWNGMLIARCIGGVCSTTRRGTWLVLTQ